MSQQLQPYTLSIDIGTNSLGWAVLDGIEDNIKGILDAGVRIFEAGMNLDDRGKAESRNLKRRQARLLRRQTKRRSGRLRRVLYRLQESGLLPQGSTSLLEGELANVMRLEPYSLRQRALDEKLSPYEVGRALYHLAQRRGFLSNKKSSKKNEDESVVKESIKHTEELMALNNTRTYGEYLAGLNPHEKRLRGRYTHRSWFENEFEAIWKAQTGFHPSMMTSDLKKALKEAIFWQRPLRNQKFLIGKCSLETNRRRASLALMCAQRVRYLQDLNHLQIYDNGYEPRLLTESERTLIIGEAEKKEKITFAAIKKMLKLPKTAIINLEAGDRKDIKGNVTAARLREAVGERWDAFTDEQKDAIVQDVMATEKTGVLVRRGKKKWNLDDSEAESLSQVRLEDDYSRLSLHALQKLLPLLEKGMPHTEAVMQAYPDKQSSTEVLDLLPPLRQFGMVRNPIVERSLTELRHLTNLLIQKYGKPEKIRIELARDLKQSAKEREKRYKAMRENEGKMQSAASVILRETGNPQPRREEKMRVQLWQECDGWCPYTGKKISISDLLGDHPKFDIEHIIPFSRSLDNSYNNLTLCCADENRQRKRNKTPHEAYAVSEPERYAEILSRVERFKNPEKLRRFKMEETGDDLIETFGSRQLNDTRYASILARDYLAQLYGGEWRSHVQVSAGGLTAYLRSAWRLNGILNDGNIKQRTDHRHHAVDAITIGLSSPKWVRTLAEISKRAYRPEQFRDVPEPWPGFISEARAKIKSIIVSHRVGKPVRGQLHNDTLYGVVNIRRGKRPEDIETRSVVRKPIHSLSEKEITSGDPPNPELCGLVRRNTHCPVCKSQIVDRAVCGAIRKAHRNHPDYKTFQARMEAPENHPVLISPSGKETPIHRLRVFQQVNPIIIGKGVRQKRVVPASNHHVEIFAAKDKRGREVWKERTVALLDAMGRRKAGLPIIANQDEDGNKLVFSLAIGEAVELEWNGERRICVVQSLSTGDYTFRLLNDARLAKEIKAAKENIRITSMSRLKELGCRKLVITIDGQVRNARD